MTIEAEIWDAVLRIQKDNCNAMESCPSGTYPRCKPAIGTGKCERCGRDVREMDGIPCVAVSPLNRWKWKDK